MSFAETTGPKGRRFQQSSWRPKAASERRGHRKAAEAKRRSRPKGGLTPTGRRGAGGGAGHGSSALRIVTKAFWRELLLG